MAGAGVAEDLHPSALVRAGAAEADSAPLRCIVQGTVAVLGAGKREGSGGELLGHFAIVEQAAPDQEVPPVGEDAGQVCDARRERVHALGTEYGHALQEARRAAVSRPSDHFGCVPGRGKVCSLRRVRSRPALGTGCGPVRKGGARPASGSR